MGNIAEALLKAGAKLGVSSRGSGNVNESGRVSDFDIVTVDIVAQPSAPDAYPKTIYESLFNMRGGAQLFDTASALTHDKSAENHLMKAITGFINELKIKQETTMAVNFKDLLENADLTSEVKDALQEAWNNKVSEAREIFSQQEADKLIDMDLSLIHI